MSKLNNTIIYLTIILAVNLLYAGIIEEIKNIAEKDGYGYKYANLTIINNLAQNFNQEKEQHYYNILVPEFVGISSDNIKTFLKNKGVNIDDKWSIIIEKNFSQDEITKTIHNKQFSDLFILDQKIFENELRKNVNNIIENTKNDSLSLDQIFATEGLDKLLDEVSNKNERLMVRSTGKEDTKKLANAGGNISVPNVAPNKSDIIIAILEVVISYFSQKSLKQRLDAGDYSIFDPKYITPVLIQRMIGEKEYKAIPKSGVMFTEEPDGGIARYALRDDENNVIEKIKTTGNTLIQAAFGHNEGVVNSLIPVDTYYITKTYDIFPVIRPKTYRMSPDPKINSSLIMMSNDDDIVHLPALSRDSLKTLKIFSEKLENIYNDAMDVEFVVDDDVKTIYIVQCRPIVHKNNLAPASYIINDDEITKKYKTFVGETIGIAGGSLRVITKPEHIIVASNIGNALQVYQNKKETPDTSAIQVIIIGKMSPSTSHEATAFRSEGKPVIYIKDSHKIVDLLLKGESFIVSPQQGLVVNWKGKEKTVEDIIASKQAVKGFINYPIPRLISMSEYFEPDLSEKSFDIILKKFMPEVTEIAKKKFSDIRSLIYIVKQGLKADAEAALMSILSLLRDELKEAVGKNNNLDESYRHRISIMIKYALLSAKNLFPYLDAKPDDYINFSQRLFYVRILESILLQNPSLGEVEDAMFSFERIIKGLAEEKNIYAVLRDKDIHADSLIVKLMRFGSLAFADEIKDLWQNFIPNALNAGGEKVKKDFQKMILDLGEFGALTMWLHTSFYEQATKSSDALIVAQNLLQEFHQASELIKDLSIKIKIMKSFNINAFENPKNFDNQWTNFNNQLLDYFLSDIFNDQYQYSSKLVKFIAIGAMTKLVDIFDLSIKALSGSQFYNDSKMLKIERFQKMLQKYSIMLEKLINLQNDNSRKITLGLRDNIIKSIVHIPNPSIDYLKASPEFIVSAFTIGIGNQSLAYLAIPKTGEDIFTLIHQSMLVILGRLAFDAGAANIKRPILLEMVENIAEDSGAFIVGMSFAANSMILNYNLPMNEHSGQLEIRYDQKLKNVVMGVRFFGSSLNQRWKKIYDFIKFFNDNKIFNVNNIQESNNFVSFELIVSNYKEKDFIIEILKECKDITYDSFGYKKLDPVIITSKHILNLKGQDMALDFAVNAVKKGSKSSLSVFKNLFEQDFGFEKAVSAAYELIYSNDDNKKNLGFDLIIAVVKAGRGFTEALDIADAAINNEAHTDNIRDFGLSIFKTLFEKNQGFEEAIASAVRAFNNIDDEVRASGRKLFKELLKKGKGFTEAEKINDKNLNRFMKALKK